MNVNIDIIVNFSNLLKAAKEKIDENRRKFLETKSKEKLQEKVTEQKTRQQQQQQQEEAANQAARINKAKLSTKKKDEEPSANRRKDDTYILSPLKEPTGQPNNQYRPPEIPYEQWVKDPNTFKFTQNGHIWLYQNTNNQPGEVIYDFPQGRKSIKPTDGTGANFVKLVPRWDYLLSEGLTAEAWFYNEPLSNLPKTGGTAYRLGSELSIRLPEDHPYYNNFWLLNSRVRVYNSYMYGTLELYQQLNISVGILANSPYRSVPDYAYIEPVLEYNISSFANEGWNHHAYQISKDKTFTAYLNGVLIAAIYEDGSFYSNPDADSVNYLSPGYQETGNVVPDQYDTSYVLASSWKKLQFEYRYDAYSPFVNDKYESRGYFRGVRLTPKQRYPVEGFSPIQYQ